MEENKNSTNDKGIHGSVEDAPKKKRGFAAMDRAKVRLIASLGGKAAHAMGTAHQFSSEEARIAGSKGGKAPHVRRGRGKRSEAPTLAPPAEAQTAAE